MSGLAVERQVFVPTKTCQGD